MKTGDLLCLIIVIFLVLLLWSRHQNATVTEKFDTYYNHDYGAYNVYKNEKLPIKTVEDASLKAKYQWSERDPLGYTLYDKMFDAVVEEKNATTDSDYGYRDTESGLDNVYDTKFSTLDGRNELNNYKISDMHDPNIIQNIINGQKISLAQAQY